jgi:2,3-diaminopropionate biosynthesis protein SbnB
MSVAGAPTFYVVSGSTVKGVIGDHRDQIFHAVEMAYRLHSAGESINPDSYFLRYPDKPRNRIIALPAHLGGEVQKSGIKWISSFPENTAVNLARASAVQILNDATTGYPIACIEASLISATRTAASAAWAAEVLSPSPFSGSLCVVGTGVISRTTIEWLKFRNWQFSKVCLYDVNQDEAHRFCKWLRDDCAIEAEVKGSLEEAASEASLIVFATTALEPYVDDEKLFKHAPTVLHLSLRDILPNVILASQNIVDDIEHCLKARTSPHLAEIETGNRDFVSGTLVDAADKRFALDFKRPRIFSPFGLGVLDLAVSNFVLDAAVASNAAVALPDFFSNSTRW